MTDIAHLRALLAAAIQRPWFTHPHDVPGEPFPWTTSVFVTGGAQDSVPRLLVARADNPDATLIAEAVNALPALLDELERLREMLGRLVSLGWIMDSLPEDLALDLYHYDRPVLSPEPKPETRKS